MPLFGEPSDALVEAALRRSIELAALATHPLPAYAIDGDARVIYVNPGWFEFARANGAKADSAVLAHPLGTDLASVTPEVLRPYYADLLAAARAGGGARVSHLYECSSAGTRRTFVMHLYRVEGTDCLLIVNSCVREQPQGEGHRALEDEFRGSHGLIEMCASCRRTRRVAGVRAWEFVPEWVETLPARVTHGLCSPCADELYGPLLRDED